jgi:hypothetical protein
MKKTSDILTYPRATSLCEFLERSNQQFRPRRPSAMRQQKESTKLIAYVNGYSVEPHCRFIKGTKPRRSAPFSQHTSAYVSIRQHTSAYVSTKSHQTSHWISSIGHSIGLQVTDVYSLTRLAPGVHQDLSLRSFYRFIGYR